MNKATIEPRKDITSREDLLRQYHALHDSDYCDERQYAARRGVSRSLIQAERRAGSGLAFYKRGARVVYLKADIEDFLNRELKRYTSTSEYEGNPPVPGLRASKRGE